MRAAKPVWPAGREKEWNCQVGFTAEFDGTDAKDAVLRYTGATMCRVFLNGEFFGYGPARAAHGFVRVEELPLAGKLKPGRNVVAIEVAGYNCDSFYTVRQPSFLQAEIVAGEKVIAATDAKSGTFKAGVLNYRVKKVPRLSFQRTFSEVYQAWPYDNEWRFGIRPPFVVPCTLAEQPQLPLLPRIVPVPDYAILPAKTLVATGTVKYDEKLPVKTPRSMTCTEGKSWRRDGWKVSELEQIPYYDMQRTVTVSRKEVGGASPSELIIPGKGFALVDFGFLAAGFPKMTVNCDGPGELYFCFDEVLENGDISMKRLASCCNIIKWRISEGGIYRLEAFEPYAFRYGKLIFFGNTCKVSELSIREYVNPEAGRAKFKSSDPDIDKIFEAARRTFAENAVDGFMDCPSRERAGWNCDAFFTGRASIEFTGNAKEEKIFIENFLLPKKFPDIPDGMLPQCYPADFPDHSMIPNWAMWFVLELDEYYARTGDRAMVEAFRPRILKLMDFFWKYRNDDGLLEKLPPSVFVEWSRSNALTRDVNYPTNMTWARVLEVVARLYGADATSASHPCNLREEAERVRETVRRQSWNGTFFVDRALRLKDGTLKPDTEATETCQYYAFFFGTATPESHSELWKRLVEDFGPGRKKNNKWPAVAFSNAFIGNYLRFECLSKAGLSAKILDEAKEYFSFMADRTGTLWEHDAPTASCCHGFASHIAHVFYRDVLGVQKIDRVKKVVTIRIPDVPLDSCSGEIPVGDGAVKLSWRREGGNILKEYSIPDGYAVVFADGTIPLPEHPRPDWERAQWVNLNGQWDFGFEKGVYDRKITVPFGWGSPLSGVANVKGKDTGYYRRTVRIPQGWKGKRVFLVVGAADYDTEFTFDGKTLGKHVGGYTPFEFELTDLVKWGEEQTAEFKIWDPDFFTAYNGHYLFGKQGYGNVRGIWQTVYLEARGREYIDSVRFIPWIAKESDPSFASQVLVDVMLSAPMKSAGVFRMVVDGREESVNVNAGDRKFRFHVGFDKPHLWTLDDPYLYDVTLMFGDDAVKSYFGFREVGTGKNANGDAYVTLNGKPIYLQMCLDQSYHPKGYYTFPTDEYMKNEILISKKLALSGNRVHIKVEMPRKLYWADRLGLLIQADVPNAWGPASDAMFAEHWKCFEDMVKRDFNHPSIYQWTLFNETWGLLSARYGKKGGKYEPATQRRVADAYRKAKDLDPTRLIDDNSVCLRDHVATDVNTWHRYCPAYAWYDKLERVCTNTYVGSVCNYAKGYAQNGAPMMNAECGNVWGYKGSTGDCDFTWDYHAMINAFRSHLKCGGWLYTEHHDVIIEWNGYVREDRTWKETGLEELADMTLADLHGKAALFMQRKRGYETGEVVRPGEKVVIPVGVSFITDEFAGKELALVKSAWWFDGTGRKCESETMPLDKTFVAKSWQCEKLWDVEFTAPDGPACGCVVFDLIDMRRKIVARNFWSFSTVAKDAAMLKPKASKWSEGTAEVMGGLKLNGFGKGWFEYEIAVPPQGGTFRAELSAKRKNWKDRDGAGRALDYPTGKRTMERSKNPNSYPQTCEHKFPANLTVRVGGKVALKRVLPDDPADHRGLLSWLAQPHDGRLREAGSYGWLVEVKVPPEAVKDGKATIRLESDAGLAVYGPRFGRYPLGPCVFFHFN